MKTVYPHLRLTQAEYKKAKKYGGYLQKKYPMNAFPITKDSVLRQVNGRNPWESRTERDKERRRKSMVTHGNRKRIHTYPSQFRKGGNQKRQRRIDSQNRIHQVQIRERRPSSRIDTESRGEWIHVHPRFPGVHTEDPVLTPRLFARKRKDLDVLSPLWDEVKRNKTIYLSLYGSQPKQSLPTSSGRTSIPTKGSSRERDSLKQNWKLGWKKSSRVLPRTKSRSPRIRLRPKTGPKLNRRWSMQWNKGRRRTPVGSCSDVKSKSRRTKRTRLGTR